MHQIYFPHSRPRFDGIRHGGKPGVSSREWPWSDMNIQHRQPLLIGAPDQVANHLDRIMPIEPIFVTLPGSVEAGKDRSSGASAVSTCNIIRIQSLLKATSLPDIFGKRPPENCIYQAAKPKTGPSGSEERTGSPPYRPSTSCFLPGPRMGRLRQFGVSEGRPASRPGILWWTIPGRPHCSDQNRRTPGSDPRAEIASLPPASARCRHTGDQPTETYRPQGKRARSMFGVIRSIAARGTLLTERPAVLTRVRANRASVACQ